MLQTTGNLRGFTFCHCLIPHVHVFLSYNTIIDAKVIRPQLTNIEHVIVLQIGGTELLSEVERYHIHSIHRVLWGADPRGRRIFDQLATAANVSLRVDWYPLSS